LTRLPLGLMLELKDKYRLDAFLETGTSAAAETTLQAALHFDRVFTVELTAIGYRSACERLKECPNVDLRCGSSPAFIRGVLAVNPELRFLFWLDAHWCGGPKLGPECPLLHELAEIAPTHAQHVILIDDARLFLNPPPPPHDPAQWPAFETVRELCLSWEPQPTVTVQDDIIIVEPA